MAYTILQNKTKGEASKVQANFEYIGSGNLLPMGGTNLDYTTGIYNLGSDNYKWNNLYVNSITNEYNEEIKYKNLNIVPFNYLSNRIDFLNLNGDLDIIYKIQGRLYLELYSPTITAYTGIKIYLNGDSSTNYGYERIQAIGNSISANNNANSNGILFWYSPSFAFNASTTIYFNMTIYAKTGFERTIIIRTFQNNIYDVAGIIPMQLSVVAGIWNNTTQTLTNINIVSDFYGATYSACIWSQLSINVFAEKRR